MPKNTLVVDEPRDEKPAEPSAVDKVRADVEPRTDPLAAIEALVTGQAAAFKVAAELGDVEAHEVASQFEAKARELAEAALKNVEAEWAKGKESFEKRGGYVDPKAHDGGVSAVEREQPGGLRSPMAPAASLVDVDRAHNAHAVERAVEHGMDPGLAHQMTTHGSNS